MHVVQHEADVGCGIPRKTRAEAVLRARKAGDTTRSREFFAYYLNHLLPLKREWFREKKNVTFLSTDGLTARQVGEKVKHWCEQYI